LDEPDCREDPLPLPEELEPLALLPDDTEPCTTPTADSPDV
jgi:hypothetical protein